MKVKWTRTAIGHLADVYDYISRDSAQYVRVTLQAHRLRPVGRRLATPAPLDAAGGLGVLDDAASYISQGLLL